MSRQIGPAGIETHRKVAWVMWLAVGCLVAGWVARAESGAYRASPHGSQQHGVWRLAQLPRGSCGQCHFGLADSEEMPRHRDTSRSNQSCFATSLGGCHADKPSGGTAGYPAQESDRMLLGSTDPGYFEFNGGGVRIPGVRHRVRWTGRDIWEDDVHSTHFSDQDMPIKDSRGDGSCANCHNVHGSAAQHDMLHNNYRGITGSEFGLQPQGYAACLVCHSINGPLGMDESSRSIGYYYDRSVNPEHSSGHGISQGGGYVATGSRLPCFDCHNPHGSMGHDAQRPNRYLLSDQRPGWFGLDDIKNDNRQVRRFCFGCHPPADRTHTRSEAVEGLILPRLTGAVFAHSEDADRHCYDCHGRDYTSPTARNVHNPAKGVTPLIDDVTR